MLVFGGKPFGMCLGHEGRALIIGLVPLKKKPQRDNRRKTDVYEPESRASPDTESANTLTLDFPFRTVRNKFLLFISYLVYCISITVTQIDKDRM